MRGVLDDSFIILDEAQNTTPEQMKMFLTHRFRSKAVVTGDITQIDLPGDRKSGLRRSKKILKGVEGVEFIYLTEKDVVRHELVQRIIKAYDKYDRIPIDWGLRMKAINKEIPQKVMFRIRNRTIQRVLAALVTVIIAVFIIESGATPKKYRLEVGESSKYDITAPRDIVNVLLTEKLAKETADKVPPVMERLDDVPIDIINSANEFTDQIKAARQGLADLHGMRHSTDGGNGESLEEQEAVAAGPLLNKMDELGIRFRRTNQI